MLKNNYINVHISEVDVNIPLQIKTTNEFCKINFCENIHKIIQKYKYLIDECYEDWNKIKFYTNIFELLNYNSHTKYYRPLTLYEPISRAYFKLWEILHNFEILNFKKEITYCALAEGPGGFVECVSNYRKKKYPDYKDKYYCITLKNSELNWNKLKYYKRKKKKQYKNTLWKGWYRKYI